MGFEISYFFKHEIDAGVYSEEVEKKTVRVGGPYEDTPLEAAAGKIIAQLAKRKILVTDVEVYEYTKKKITVKITDDGVIIKHKKFSFDDGPAIVPVGDEQPDAGQGDSNALLASLLNDPQVIQIMHQKQHLQSMRQGQPQVLVPGVPRAVTPSAPVQIPGRPLRYEIFDPELPNLHEAKKMGARFTQGKKYPIVSERMSGIPPVTNTWYMVVDDTGSTVEMHSKFFALPTQGKLAFEDEMKGGPSSMGEPKLMWGDEVRDSDMPAIR